MSIEYHFAQKFLKISIATINLNVKKIMKKKYSKTG